MPAIGLISVGLDQELVEKLLRGLCNGARAKALKVVISADGHYHVESKELRILIEVEENGTGMKRIRINNEKQTATITALELERMGLAALAAEIVRELRTKYSPVFHSLAENIVVFGRTYGG